MVNPLCSATRARSWSIVCMCIPARLTLDGVHSVSQTDFGACCPPWGPAKGLVGARHPGGGGKGVRRRTVVYVSGALLALLLAGLGSGFVNMLGPIPEQAVEGHTVFTVIQGRYPTSTTENDHFATAVAVLIREFHRNTVALDTRFPGVLWFNDQYLVTCSSSCANVKSTVTKTIRYPCGAV